MELFGVSKSYTLAGGGAGEPGAAVSALREVNLVVRRGEFVVIRGPSGGGKTSLLNVIGTIDAPSGGRLRLFGRDVFGGAAAPGGGRAGSGADAALADLRLRKIGFIFQSFNLLATLSAVENVELPVAMLGRAPPAAGRAAALALLRLVGLEDRGAHLPSELSGGEQQRVAIARALVNTPELVLLDEPTGDLDTRNTVAVMDLLLKINLDAGVTLVMVTHNPDLECYADRVVYVADGRVVGTAVNTAQSRLHHEDYLAFLHREADGDGDA